MCCKGGWGLTHDVRDTLSESQSRDKLRIPDTLWESFLQFVFLYFIIFVYSMQFNLTKSNSTQFNLSNSNLIQINTIQLIELEFNSNRNNLT